jgi:hypothetical protein
MGAGSLLAGGDRLYQVAHIIVATIRPFVVMTRGTGG